MYFQASVGSGEPLVYPKIGRKLDYEGELTVVIGRRGRHISPEQAYRHIAGYTIMQADNLDTAVGLVRTHPFITRGGSLQVLEAVAP